MFYISSFSFFSFLPFLFSFSCLFSVCFPPPPYLPSFKLSNFPIRSLQQMAQEYGMSMVEFALLDDATFLQLRVCLCLRLCVRVCVCVFGGEERERERDREREDTLFDYLFSLASPSGLSHGLNVVEREREREREKTRSCGSRHSSFDIRVRHSHHEPHLQMRVHLCMQSIVSHSLLLFDCSTRARTAACA
jgi:hypothetical protein